MKESGLDSKLAGIKRQLSNFGDSGRYKSLRRGSLGYLICTNVCKYELGDM